MIFNKHLELKGKHALISPSKYYQLKYDVDSIPDKLNSVYASDIGTVVHSSAALNIEKCHKIKTKSGSIDIILNALWNAGIPDWAIRLADVEKIAETFSLYVNDSINFSMEPEVVLKYTDNCFGTADAISYFSDDRLLRIHDLKTGNIPAHFEQLEEYAALFCYEYGIDPKDIQTELRIYQTGEVFIMNPGFKDIRAVMEKLKELDAAILEVKDYIP